MSKKSFLLVLSVLSILLVTMAVSRPFTNASISTIEGANDFYQRHRNWNRDLTGSDYFERHTNPGTAASIAEFAGDFALRHPRWSISVPNAPVYVIDNSVMDYFQRHPELRTPATIDLSDYFLRH